MSEHGAAGSSVSMVTTGPGSKARAVRRARAIAGKRQIVALAAAVALVGGVTACSSSPSTSSMAPASASVSAPQTGASEAPGIPADVLSAYFKAACTAPSTYDEATETCTDEQGQATTASELNYGFAPVRAMQVSIAYAVLPPERFPACPPKADMDAYQNDEDDAVAPPAVSDECLTSVLVAMTGLVGGPGSQSEASGIPSGVISGYFKATCTAPSTYDEATEACTDEQGQAQSVGEFAPSLAMTPVRAINLTLAYGFFPPDDFPACPPKADLDAYTDDTSGTVDPPAISDECMTSVLVALTGFMG